MEALLSMIKTMFICTLIIGGVLVVCMVTFPAFRSFCFDLGRHIAATFAICTISLILALIYIISPIDLIPDPIPILGQIDDLGIVGAALMTIPIRLIYMMKLLLDRQQKSSCKRS
jgi:hypothetical protein